jgi:hypothetical protein
VGDNLDGLAEVVPAALLEDDLLVDAAGGEVVVAGELGVGEALIVPEVGSVSAPSSVTKTSPCWKGDMVPGSTLR